VSDGLRTFVLVVAGLFLLRLFFGFVLFPEGVAGVLSLFNAVVFLGLPVYAMFRAASHNWQSRHSMWFLVVGALMHVGGGLLARFASGPASPAEVLYMAIVQAGILCWTLGLGTLLALFIKDRNLMIPIAIFLVGFDMFLVFNPDSPTRRMLAGSPQVTQSMLATVPAAKSTEQPKAGVRDLAHVGPADLLFAATFFALMFRFEMRAKRTLAWLLPVLVVYLLVVIYLGDVRLGPLSLGLLPAMVPIGLTVLLVNRRQFKLQGQEVLGVLLVTLLAAGLAWFGIYRASQARTLPESLPAPSPSEGGQSAPGLEGSPAPGP
jgi:hypothetical protein